MQTFTASDTEKAVHKCRTLYRKQNTKYNTSCQGSLRNFPKKNRFL